MSRNTETLLTTSRFHVERVVQKTRNGELHERAIVRHPGAVTILPMVDEQHVCLIRNFRISVDSQNVPTFLIVHWCCCGVGGFSRDVICVRLSVSLFGDFSNFSSEIETKSISLRRKERAEDNFHVLGFIQPPILPKGTTNPLLMN